jgi:hypothetical protein
MKTKYNPDKKVYFFVSPHLSPNDLNNNEYNKRNFILEGRIVEVIVQYKVTKNATEIVFEKYKVEVDGEDKVFACCDYFPSVLDIFDTLDNARKRAKEVLEDIVRTNTYKEYNYQKSLSLLDEALQESK